MNREPITDITQLPLDQIQRFQRHLGLDGFGPDAQLRLVNAHVAVIGAGGLGAPVLTYLAAAGVGAIDVIDDDVVDRSNLHRQVIHSESFVGQPKTTSAAAAMKGLNPHIHVREITERITPSRALDMLRHADLVIDGCDNFATRYTVADACEILGKPLIYGAILRFSGQVSVFWPGRGPLYRDVFPTAPEAGEVPSCAEAGVIGVLPGVIGTLMATEAIKVLCGIGQPLIGRLLIYDALAASVRELRLSADPARIPATEVAPEFVDAFEDEGSLTGCTLPDAAPHSVSTSQLRDMIDGPQPPLLLDVREPWEVALGIIPGAVTMSLDQIEAGADPLPHMDHAPDEQAVVIYCKAGIRSLRALDLLHARHPNRKMWSLSGGYDAWVRDEAHLRR